MKRTKQWWAALEPQERSELVQLERDRAGGDVSGWNLPEGYFTCAHCGYPRRGRGLCWQCGNRLQELIAKADKAIITGAPDVQV